MFTQSTVLVKVGPNEVEFYVHKALAMQHSAFFRGALGTAKSKEIEAGVFILRDIKPCTFTAFLDWLYHSDLPDWDEWFKQYCNGGENVSWQLQVTCLYVFANRYLIPELKVEVIKHAIKWDFDDKVPEPGAITFAYENLPRHSPFLKFLVDCFLATFEEDSYKEADGSELGVFASFPHEFTHSVILKYATKRNKAHVEMKVSDYIESKQKEDGEHKEGKEDGGNREVGQPSHDKRKTFRRTL